MNTHFPKDNNLSIRKLTQVFNNTSASYKYYWFISLLQLLVKSKNNTIKVTDILIQMICNAWYPVNYFKLSFGFSDKLHRNILELQEKLAIPMDTSLENLFIILKNSDDTDVKKLITHFSLNVPYRFLSPWIPFTSNKDVINKSREYKNNCIYKISKENSFEVEINPNWIFYLKTNYRILIDFSYWKLTLYLQSNNVNIPNIPTKLIKPIERDSLSKQRGFWNTVFNKIDTIDCIYSNVTLTKDNYVMEHFIPWSFVSHNQLWNLIPADSSINSSKSNKLPLLTEYLKPFVTVQREAIKIVYEQQPKNKLLEDYLFLGNNIPKILDMSEKELTKGFKNTIEPLIQIANNSGFEIWKNFYKK